MYDQRQGRDYYARAVAWIAFGAASFGTWWAYVCIVMAVTYIGLEIARLWRTSDAG